MLFTQVVLRLRTKRHNVYWNEPFILLSQPWLKLSHVAAFLCFDKSPIRVYANSLLSAPLIDFLDSIKWL